MHAFLYNFSNSTSITITDNVAWNFYTVGLILMIVLRLTLIAGMDPPDMAVNFLE